MNYLIRRLALINLFLFGFVVNVNSAEYLYEIYQDVEYSDNVAQEEEGESGSIYNGGIAFRLESTESQNYEMFVDGQWGVTDYYQLDLKTEQIRRFEGNFLYKPVRSNFTLELFDSYSQVPQNRFITQSIGNVAEVHVYGAIPRYFFNITPTDRIVLEVAYNQLKDQDALTPLADNSRKQTRASIGYEKAISAVTSLGISYRKSNTEFDVRVAEYEVEDVLANWSYDRGITQIDLSVGKSEAIDLNTDEMFENELIELSIARSINENASLILNGRKGVGQDFNFDLSNTAGNVSVNSQAGFIRGLREEVQYSLGYNYTGFLYDFGLRYSSEDIKGIDDSITNADDQEQVGINANMRFDLANYLQSSLPSDIELSYSYNENTFTALDIENQISLYSIRCNYFLNAKSTIYAQYSHRNAEEANTGVETKENVYMLGFSYSPRGRIAGF